MDRYLICMLAVERIKNQSVNFYRNNKKLSDAEAFVIEGYNPVPVCGIFQFLKRDVDVSDAIGDIREEIRGLGKQLTESLEKMKIEITAVVKDKLDEDDRKFEKVEVINMATEIIAGEEIFSQEEGQAQPSARSSKKNLVKDDTTASTTG